MGFIYKQCSQHAGWSDVGGRACPVYDKYPNGLHPLRLVALLAFILHEQSGSAFVAFALQP